MDVVWVFSIDWLEIGCLVSIRDGERYFYILFGVYVLVSFLNKVDMKVFEKDRGLEGEYVGKKVNFLGIGVIVYGVCVYVELSEMFWKKLEE